MNYNNIAKFINYPKNETIKLQKRNKIFFFFFALTVQV